jgi:hypothetical protein
MLRFGQNADFHFLSGEECRQHITGDVGKAVIAAIVEKRELFVIDA